MRDHPVNSTSTFTPVDPISAPSKTLETSPQHQVAKSLSASSNIGRHLSSACGGAARYRTGVQYVSTLLQRLQFIYYHKQQLLYTPCAIFLILLLLYHFLPSFAFMSSSSGFAFGVFLMGFLSHP